MAVNTWLRPLGAALRIPVLRMCDQSAEGKLPRAGRLIKEVIISGEVATFSKCGLLYPTGIDAI